jgi:uncharacterized membrane protein YphA (DoxX/SURF4 family)
MTNVIVFLFMVLFLYAALNKIMEFHRFRADLGKSPFISQYAGILVWVVPIVEIITALILFIPKTRVIGMYLSFFIMLAFTLYISMMMVFSPSLPCSCGGIISHLSWIGHLIFNSVFTLFAILGTYVLKQKEYQQPITTL